MISVKWQSLPVKETIAAPPRDDPGIAKLAPQQGARLHELYTAAAAAKPEFDATLSAIAKEVDGTPHLARLKTTARAVQEIAADYEGDVGQIKDLLRATILVDNPDQARAALVALESRMTVMAAGKRDMIDGEPGPDGFRDIKVNVDLGNGLVAEVQINLPDMLEAKKVAHPLFVEREAIRREAIGHDRTPEEQARIGALNAQQREIYAAAFERARARTSATNGQNLASDMGAPLRWADDGSNDRGGSRSQATEDVTEAGSDGLKASGTSENLSPSDTGISPSISKNSAIEEPPVKTGAHDDGGIKAAIPAELTQQIAALEQDFAGAAEHLDPEAQAELARITEADQRAQSVLGAITQAATCMLGGLA
jgi:hypothetical protein